MWYCVVEHLDDSRIYKRENSKYFEVKWQNYHGSFISRTYFPFRAALAMSFNPKTRENTPKNLNFAQKAPINLEISSDKSYALTMRLQPKTESMPPLLTDPCVFGTLYGTSFSSMAGVIGMELQKKLSLSIALNPHLVSMSYYGGEFGSEFVYSFTEEQPSLSVVFHRIRGRNEVTVMGSMYGGVNTLISTDLKYAKVHSMLDFNAYTLQSSAKFGFSIPIRNSSVSMSLSVPSWSFSIEGMLNKTDEDGHGFTFGAYLPFSFSKTKNI